MPKKSLALIFILLIIVIDHSDTHAFSWQKDELQLNLRGAARLSINNDTTYPTSASGSVENFNLSGNFSHVQVDGTYALEEDLKALFKFEWKIDPTETSGNSTSNTITDFEQYIGMETQFGKGRVGTIVSPYMQTGLMLDPFRRDALSARFFVDIQSALHHSNGKGRGRSTNTLRYDSPSFLGGMNTQFFVGFDNTADNDHSFGGGLTYKKNALEAFLQYYNNGEPGDDEALKIGGKYTMGNTTFFGQYELDMGLISLAENLTPNPSNTSEDDNIFEDNSTTRADVWHLGCFHKWERFLFIGQFGGRLDSDDGVASEDGHKGWLLGGSWHLRDFLYFYTGYMQKKHNDDRGNDVRLTLGSTLTF